MVSLEALIMFFIIFFAIIGALRGWSRELVVTAGLVLGLFIIDLMGIKALSYFNMAFDPNDPTAAPSSHRNAFWIFTVIYLLLVFFSYQGPAFSGTIGGRLKANQSFQSAILGFLVGGLNGFLMLGTFISFLEYRPTVNGFERLGFGQPYPFSPDVIQRISVDPMPVILQYLPFESFNYFGGMLLPLLVVALFLFIIIVAT